MFLLLNGITGALNKKTVLRNKDTLFAKRSDPATAISRETVSRKSALQRLRPLPLGCCITNLHAGSLQSDCRGVKQVAAVLVKALFQPRASGRVVEIVASPVAPATLPSQWFKA